MFGLVNDVTSLDVAASFTKTDEKDQTLNFKVVGFDAAWTAQVETEGQKFKDVKAKLTALTVDATNIADLTNGWATLTKLASLTITGGAKTVTAATALALTDDVKKSLTTLDIAATGIKSGLDFAVSGDIWKKLTALTLPSVYEEIGANSFQATNLASLAVPASVKSIGAEAFKGAAALATIDLSGTKVTKIEASTFEGAKKLASATFPVGLTEIGASAFKSCEALAAIDITAKVTTLGDNVFDGCKALASVSGMAEVTTIPIYAFRGCEKLASFAAPAKLAAINGSAFTGCKALTTVTFAGDKLTAIYGYAFAGCEALATIDLSAQKIATLGGNIFKDAKALTAVDLSKATITTIDATTFSGCAKLATVKVPKTLTSLPAGVFAGTVLTSLDLSETGITLLEDIFQGTDKKPYATLTSITLPKVLEGIDDLGAKDGVFAYCTGLEEITLPGSLIYDVPDFAFYFATSLKTVTYQPDTQSGESVVEIGEKAFIGCTPFVLISANADYRATWPDVPFNATFGDDADLKVTTVADKGTSGMFFGKLCPQVDVIISKEDLGDVKLYSVYIDEDVAYFQNLRVGGGYYRIEAGEHVIIKSKAATTIEFTPVMAGSTLMGDDIEEANNFKDVTVSDFQANDLSIWYARMGWTPKYLYLLTNSASNGGFGFTFFKGTNMKKGNFFISTDAAPAAGRLQTVWLDEDGNVESDATAIQKIEAATEDGAIYNLQGVRVNAAKKGLYIQNGKKYIK